MGFPVLWCWPYFRLVFWVLYLLRFGVSVVFCSQFPIFGIAIRYGLVVSSFFSENMDLSDLNYVHIFLVLIESHFGSAVFYYFLHDFAVSIVLQCPLLTHTQYSCIMSFKPHCIGIILCLLKSQNFL